MGFIRKDLKNSTFALDDYLADALYFDTLRGTHSTGLFVKDYDTLRKEWSINYHKEAVNGIQFTNTKEFTSLVRPQTNLMFAVGHNRAATQGKINDENSHPFFTENITGVHNGSLKHGWRQDLQVPLTVEVDSHAIYMAINKNGLNWTLDRLNGAYSLVWYDDRDDTLNFVRNDERPMWFVECAEFIGFGSEKYMIAAAMERRKYKVTGMSELPKNMHVKIDVSGKGAPAVITAYEPKRLYSQVTTYQGNVNAVHYYPNGSTQTKPPEATTTVTNPPAIETKPLQIVVNNDKPASSYIPKYEHTDFRSGEISWHGKQWSTRLPIEAYPPAKSDPAAYAYKKIVFSVFSVEDKPVDGKYKVIGEMVVEPEDGANIEVHAWISEDAYKVHQSAKVLLFGYVTSSKMTSDGLTLLLTIDKASCCSTIDPFAIKWLTASDWPLKREEAKTLGFRTDAITRILAATKASKAEAALLAKGVSC